MWYENPTTCKWTQAGNISINMGPLVGEKGQRHKYVFSLTTTSIKRAWVEVSFTVLEGNHKFEEDIPEELKAESVK